MIPIPMLFERTTVKPINHVYDLDEYKEIIRFNVSASEWFTVAGLRRTGKTTLVRSVIADMKIPCIYVNLWELAPYEISLRNLINKLLEEFSNTFRGRISSISRRIREISIFGLHIKFPENRPSEGLTKILKRVVSKIEKVVLIIDEI